MADRKSLQLLGPACKPRSVRQLESRRGNHLSRPCVAARLQQPTRRSTWTSSPLPRRACVCLALLPVGVAWPPTLLPTPVVSYTTFSPLPPSMTKAAVLFCGPIRGISPPGCYPAPCSLERGLSSGMCLRLPGRSSNQSHHIPAGYRRQRNGANTALTQILLESSCMGFTVGL